MFFTVPYTCNQLSGCIFRLLFYYCDKALDLDHRLVEIVPDRVSSE